MDMEFRWNRGPVKSTLDAEEAYRMGLANAALAGARPEAAAYATNTPVSYYRNAPQGDFNDLMKQASDAQNSAMAEQAQRLLAMERFKQLEAERNEYMANRKKFLNDPNTQMAIGMALGGQPGALMSLITDKSKGTKASEYQSKMDSLESDMLNAISILGQYKPSDRRNFQQMMRRIYPSKFEELENMGAVSRMGGWPAWLEFLGATQAEIDAAKAEALRKKNRVSRIRGGNK